MRLRWKRHPRATGLRAVMAEERGYDYHDGETVYVKVYAYARRSSKYGLWYWVAGWGSGLPHHNSSETPSTLEDAKKQAVEYVRRHLDAATTMRK